MSVNEKINELRRLNYFVEQDARNFPNPFLLLSDNQALNKLYLEGQAGFKLPAQVVQGRDDSEAVFDIGAANARLQRAQNNRDALARVTEEIADTKSKINERAKNIANAASLQRMTAMKSLFVTEPGASKHHHATLTRYDFARPVDSGSEPETIYSSSGSSSSFRSEPETIYSSSTDSSSDSSKNSVSSGGRVPRSGFSSSSDSSKNSVSSGRSVGMSRERMEALDRLPKPSEERKGDRVTRRRERQQSKTFLRGAKKLVDVAPTMRSTDPSIVRSIKKTVSESNEARAKKLNKVIKRRAGSDTSGSDSMGDITSEGERRGSGSKRKQDKKDRKRLNKGGKR